MPTATQKMSETAIDQLNRAMRQQPWYQEWFASKGLDLSKKIKLTDKQRKELMAVAAANGYELGDRMKIDEAGNINQKGGWAGMPPWAKTAIGAGVTAATAGLVPGVPGVGGLFGGSGGGLAASTGAPAALESAILGSAGAGGAAGTAAGTTGAVLGAAGAGKSIADRILSMAGDAGRVVGAATTAAARNRIAEGERAQNVSTLEQALAKLEADQRREGQRNIYLAGVARSPQASPYNPRPQSASPEMLEGLTNLERQALERLKTAPQYGTPNLAVPAATVGRGPSTMERIGNYVGPGLSIMDLIGKSF